jgi:hypothetical protein
MRYCTRKNVHVDRCASAWLIQRFIDPNAEFVFADGQIPIEDTIPFDMHGVAWGHQRQPDGRECCTFETILNLHNLGQEEATLTQIARIIHGADITADADETLESAGIDLLFRGLRLTSTSDQETMERGYILMDALYAGIKAEPNLVPPRETK